VALEEAIRVDAKFGGFKGVNPECNRLANKEYINHESKNNLYPYIGFFFNFMCSQIPISNQRGQSQKQALQRYSVQQEPVEKVS